jgi:DNA-binding transcriptional LysR family regulator
MEWQQIVGFYHTAKLGSFTKAAQVVFRSQSALSQQIRALEEELECTLLERVGRRRVLLTDCGVELMRFAESVLGQKEELLEKLHDIKRLNKGSLKIAAPFTTLFHLFPEIVKSYAERFPNVRLTLLDRTQEQVIELVRNADVDLGAAAESFVPKDLVAHRWRRVETVLLTPLRHPLAKRKRVTVAEILEYPLIVPPASQQHGWRSELDELLRREGVSHHILMESSNADLSSMYVEMGLGVSFATIVRDLPTLRKRKLAYVSLAHYFPDGHLAIVSRKGAHTPAYKEMFVRALLEDARRASASHRDL